MKKINYLIPIFIIPFIFSCSHPEISSNTIKIQELNEFLLDGNSNEWKDVPARELYADPYGNFPEYEDMNARFKVAWKEDKLLMFVEIKDDSLIPNFSRPWEGDAIELFLSDFHGSENIVQYSVVTGVQDNKLFYTINDFRQQDLKLLAEPSLHGKIVREKGKINLELELDLTLFNKVSCPESIGVQLYVNDLDKKNGKNQLTWHPLGHSYMNSFASFKLELSESENSVRNGTSRIVITDDEIIELFIFGSEEGDEITVRSTENMQLEFISTSSDTHEPQIFNISEMNPNHDTVMVFINGKFNALHDLFLSPRRNIKTEAQRFDREIRLFRKKDMLDMPEDGGVLFIGSSSIRRWSSLHQDFPELDIIHRGFGGSTSEDALKYMGHIVLPYNPSVIVYYEGDNDIPRGLTYEEIISNMRTFIEKAGKQDPEIKIFMISPKPSIARMHLWEKYKELHERMKMLTNIYNSVYYVDVASPMFNKNGKLREEIFIKDGIHMNEKGYDIWEEALKEKMYSAIYE